MVTQNSINKFTQDLTIDPGASGDSYIQFDINSTGEFRIGVDDTDDFFKISQGNALGTTDTMVISAAGEVTKPLQSAFYAYLSSTASNVTGDGTFYDVIYDSTAYDVNSDYATGTGLYTSPVTGKVKFEVGLQLNGIVNASVSYSILTTSNRIYLTDMYSPTAVKTVGGSCFYSSPNIADMDAGDTAYFRIYSFGEGADVNDVYGAATGGSYFSGVLIC